MFFTNKNKSIKMAFTTSTSVPPPSPTSISPPSYIPPPTSIPLQPLPKKNIDEEEIKRYSDGSDTTA